MCQKHFTACSAAPKWSKKSKGKCMIKNIANTFSLLQTWQYWNNWDECLTRLYGL